MDEQIAYCHYCGVPASHMAAETDANSIPGLRHKDCL
jgi:hypothetical protein